MYKVYEHYEDAKNQLDEHGGWLLNTQDGSGWYAHTDDEGIVSDLLGIEFVAKCERLQCWDETIVNQHKSS